MIAQPLHEEVESEHHCRHDEHLSKQVEGLIDITAFKTALHLVLITLDGSGFLGRDNITVSDDSLSSLYGTR